MDKIRLGNDIEMRWSIFTRDGDNKVPYNLEGRALTLSVVNRTGESEIEFFAEGNIVTGVFRGRDQRILGKHGVILRENNGENGMRTIDACDAFELVACSCEEALGSSGTIQLFHLTFDSTIGAITGTIDPILNYEAEQAEAERKTNEIIRKANEEQRIDNEKQRNVNEILRNIAEEERKNAEQERRVNEDLRKADEAERKTNEESRLQSESERVSSEEERLYAESIRVTNENARIASEAKRAEAETARIEAEDKRIVSEKSRLSAESSRIANEDSRRANEDSRLSAETKRVSAESKRVSAEEERKIAEEERQAKFASMVVQTTGDATDKVMSQKSVTEALKGKQNKLTAGEGISIDGDVISATLNADIIRVVDALPSVGEANLIYLVPAEQPSESDLFEEWVWTDKWERIGSAKMDLSNYATKTELAAKANLQHHHTVADITDFPELYYDATAFFASGAYPSDRYEELLEAVKAKKTVYATIDEEGYVSHVFFMSTANSDGSSSRVLLTTIFADGGNLYTNTFVLQQSGMTTLQESITGKANKATTLAGYGIGDAYTKSELDALLKKKQDTLTPGNGISIEGNVISASVAEVVDKIVNAGYVFAGVATPSTDPGTPEAKVFYIANGKGTYTNFGSIEVTEDEVVVLKYDTAWHKVATGIASEEKLTELEDRIFFNGQTIVTPTEKANLFWGGTSVQASSAAARYNGYVFELTEGVRTNTTGTLLSRFTFPSYPQAGDVGTNKTNANTEFVPTSSEKYMLVTFDGNIQPNDITFVTIREDVERNALESKVIDAQKNIKVISGVHENITIAPNARLSYFRKVDDRNISLRVIQHNGIATSFTLFESKDVIGTGAKVLATVKPSIPTSVVVESDYPYIWIFNGDYQPNGASLTLEIYETNTIYQLTMGMRAMDGVGKKIVCLGDSITAFSDSKSKTYSDYLGEKIGCDAICGGIGGTRLVARANVTSAPANLNEAWALLDIENLAKAWCNKDWTNVDIASDMVISSGGNGVNQERNINNLKNTPVTSANIVTIMGGTNDYTASISKEAIKTALKAIVSTLLTANKTLEIYVISPIVRYVNASSAAQRTPDKWSDVFQNTNGDTLVGITECIREACKECHVNFIDLYNTLCWNQTNFSRFFIDTDSTHPYNGFPQIAEKIAKGLSK